MRNLLQHTYPNQLEFDLSRFYCDFSTEVGRISLKDSKACNLCKANPSRYPIGCDENGLLIEANTPVEVLRFDEYIKQFYSGNMPENCDYLLFDSGVDLRKIAFCDISCSTKKYVEPGGSAKYPQGKRAKVRTQIQTSLGVLLQDELLATRILMIPERFALFGWREYLPKVVQADVASRAMDVFGRTASNDAHILVYDSMMVGGFCFVEVKYPAVYSW